MQTGRPSVANDDGLADAALAEYFACLDRGEVVDLEKLIASHPGCESALRQFVNRERKLQALAWHSATASYQSGQAIGDFRLVRELGRGGMGVVYEAVQLSLGRRVALKVLPGTSDSDARSRARFRNESDILAQLRHPHIVNVFVVGEEGGACYYAMELIDGGDANLLIEDPLHSAADAADCDGADSTASVGGALTERPSRARAELGSNGAKPCSPTPAKLGAWQEPGDRCRRIATIGQQIAGALSHAHSCGVLHRDVKPSNILLDRRGCAILSDFGLARMRGQETLTELGNVVGTLRYVAPENVSTTAGRADERSDVYALGASLWEMLAQRRLFEGGQGASLVRRILEEQPEPPSRFRRDVPRDLETIALYALAKQPERRYQSADAMRDDLERFLEGRPISARRTGMSERALLWAMRHRRMSLSLTAAIVLGALGAALSAILIAGARQQAVDALAASRRSEATARQQSETAAASERSVRRMLYATDMALAGAAWQAGDPGRARLLLDRHRADSVSRPGSVTFDPRGFEWHFLHRQLTPQSEVLYQGEDALYTIAQAPDGRSFATAGRESIVRLHDPKTGRILRSKPTDQGEINGLCFSPSGRYLATGGDDGTVKIWTVDDLSLHRSVQALESKVFYAEFSDGDDRVACGGEGAAQVIIHIPSGSIPHRLVGPEPPKSGLRSAVSLDGCITPSRKRLITARYIRYAEGVDGVDMWDLVDGARRELASIEMPLAVVCDSTEERVFVAGAAELQVISVKSGRLLNSTPMTNHGESLALSPDGRQLALGTATGELLVWNVNDGSEAVALTLRCRMRVHDADLFDARFESDGASVLSASRDGTVRRTVIGGEPELFRELQWARGRAIQPIPASDLVLADNPLAIRDWQTGRIVRRLSNDRPRVRAISADGKFAAAAISNAVRVWNLRSGELILDLERPLTNLENCSLSFAHGRPHLVVSDGHLRDAEHRLEAFSLPDGRCTTLTDIPNQTQWMYGCIDGGIVFREFDPQGVACVDFPSGRVRWRRPPFEVYANRAAMSRDGRWLIAADLERHALMLLDCSTGILKYRVPCHTRVGALAIADVGSSFFVGDVEGAVSVWSLEHGQKLFDLARLDSPVVGLYAAGRRVLAAVVKNMDGSNVRCSYEFSAE
ncbi:MAG: protein kinase [Pirellulales bacterium]|nr:protein kinase [Pirellulales bacterium]